MTWSAIGLFLLGMYMGGMIPLIIFSSKSASAKANPRLVRYGALVWPLAALSALKEHFTKG